MLVIKNIKLINNSNIVSIAPFFMPQSHPLDVEVLPFLIPIIKKTIIIKAIFTRNTNISKQSNRPTTNQRNI